MSSLQSPSTALGDQLFEAALQHYHAGRLVVAENLYRQVLKLRPDYIAAHYNLGLVLSDQGKPDEAAAAYRRALGIMPDCEPANNNLLNILQEEGRFSEALEAAQNMLRVIAARSSQDTNSEIATPITALLPLGRSGSLFFHSLFDGHPELATLPGVYFKGWFGPDVWKHFSPNRADTEWREHLVKLILQEFQPFFDARSRKNVIGIPFGYSCDWVAEKSGFMSMGNDQSQPFVIDQNAFASAFLSLLAPFSTIGQKVCFELIHRAFESAIRGNTGVGSREGGPIFYHIHNATPFELGHFLYHYPQARLLYIVRHPIQGMESFMLSIVEKLNAEANYTWEAGDLLCCWMGVVGKAVAMFREFHSPFNILVHSRGVRLEDVKRDAKRVMPKIAAWIGISDHPALYDSSFCGLQYWGPTSKVTGKITGFDTKAINHPVGRFLGARDVIIFETLFWPFSHLYDYTDQDEAGFRLKLMEIRPWLDMPLEFEAEFYAKLPDHSKVIEELPAYKRLHRLLKGAWNVLDRDGKYHGIVQPLEMD